MSGYCPRPSKARDQQQRPKKPPPRPPPPNITAERKHGMQKSASTENTNAVLLATLCAAEVNRPSPRPRQRRSVDATTPASDRPAVSPVPPPPPSSRPSNYSPTKLSPLPAVKKSRSGSNPPLPPARAPVPQPPVARPRKRVSDPRGPVNLASVNQLSAKPLSKPHDFHTLPKDFSPSHTSSTVNPETPPEDFSKRVYDEIKYPPPPRPPRPTQAALLNRNITPPSSRGVSTVSVESIEEEDEEDRGIYAPLYTPLQQIDQNDEEYTSLNNYVTMQRTPHTCTTPPQPSTDEDVGGLYMAIDTSTLEDNIYQAPNEDGSDATTCPLYDIPIPTTNSRRSHHVHPAPAQRRTLQNFTH